MGVPLGAGRSGRSGKCAMIRNLRHGAVTARKAFCSLPIRCFFPAPLAATGLLAASVALPFLDDTLQL